MCKDWVPPEIRITSQADLGSAYRLAPQSLVSKLLRGSFRGIAVDIQTKEQAKTTIYMKSGHMASGCVMIHDTCNIPKCLIWLWYSKKWKHCHSLWATIKIQPFIHTTYRGSLSWTVTQPLVMWPLLMYIVHLFLFVCSLVWISIVIPPKDHPEPLRHQWLRGQPVGWAQVQVVWEVFWLWVNWSLQSHLNCQAYAFDYIIPSLLIAEDMSRMNISPLEQPKHTWDLL